MPYITNLFNSIALECFKHSENYRERSYEGNLYHHDRIHLLSNKILVSFIWFMGFETKISRVAQEEDQLIFLCSKQLLKKLF